MMSTSKTWKKKLACVKEKVGHKAFLAKPFHNNASYPCTYYILVASVADGHQGQQAIHHAMVLDTYDQEKDMFIFKNTYNDPTTGQTKRFIIKRTHPNAPKELFFVHIEVRDLKNLPSQEQRKVDNKNWLDEIEEKIGGYMTISDFAQGWTFFTKEISNNNEKYGKFPCSDFSCSGCDDWLDCGNQDRNVTKVSTLFLFFGFRYIT